MNDDRMDELLSQAARDYNAPPIDVPRDEIWSRIQAERSARSLVRRDTRSATRLWVWPSVGVAAAVLLAVGVVVGRRVERAASVSSPPNTVAAARPTPVDSSASLSYRLVVLKHLAGSEAMITAFRSSARRGEVDAQIADWSTELLSTTRMLESSPATDDPTMKRLLEDLDLVLAQIKQYAARGTTNRDELDLIEQSIIKRGVMTQLRSTVPGRTAPAGT